jgi:MFS family permease
MFLLYASPGAMLPMYSLHLQHLRFTYEQIAACCATQAMATVCASLLAGHVADRWISAERLLGICSLLAGLDLWLLAELSDWPGVFAATLGFWLLTGPILLLGASISFSHLKQPEREFGPVRMWGTVGWMTAAWLIGLWFWLSRMEWLPSWREFFHPERTDHTIPGIFRIGGLLSLALSVYSLSLPHTPPQPARDGKPAPLAALQLLRGRAFFVYTIGLFGVCFTYPFTTQGTPLLLDKLGVPRAWMAPTLTLAQVTEVISLGLLPMLLLRLGVRGTMFFGLAAWTTALTAQAIGGPVELVVGSLAFNGLCISGFFVAGQVFVNSRVHDGLRASVQALITFVNGMGMLFGNLLIGWLRKQANGELPQVFAVGALVMMILLVFFAFGFHDRRLT